MPGVIINNLETELKPNGTQADEALTVDDTAGGVQLAAIDAATTHVYWTVHDNPIRVTFDDSAPTTTNGHVIAAGASGTWKKESVVAAKFIRDGASSAVFHASQMTR